MTTIRKGKNRLFKPVAASTPVAIGTFVFVYIPHPFDVVGLHGAL